MGYRPERNSLERDTAENGIQIVLIDAGSVSGSVSAYGLVLVLVL